MVLYQYVVTECLITLLGLLNFHIGQKTCVGRFSQQALLLSIFCIAKTVTVHIVAIRLFNNCAILRQTLQRGSPLCFKLLIGVSTTC